MLRPFISSYVILINNILMQRYSTLELGYECLSSPEGTAMRNFAFDHVLDQDSSQVWNYMLGEEITGGNACGSRPYPNVYTNETQT
jgi:hypothetical protein